MLGTGFMIRPIISILGMLIIPSLPHHINPPHIIIVLIDSHGMMFTKINILTSASPM